MKKSLQVLLTLFFALSFVSCNNDDDSSSTEEVLADREDQADIDDDVLKIFMDTYTYNDQDFEGDHDLNDQDIEFYKLPLTNEQINSGKTSGDKLSESDLLIEYPITYEYEEDKFITQNVYVIKVREGDGEIPVYETSRVNTTYDMRIINSNIYEGITSTTIASESLDENTSKVWLPSNNLIRGIRESSILFRGGTSIDGTNNDCQVFNVDENGELKTNNDFGIGIIMLPSGLAYFNGTFYYDDEIEDIVDDEGEVINDLDSEDDDNDAYRKLVYTFSIYNAVDQDLDGDGIPSQQEKEIGNDDDDLDEHDTDNDGTPNYLDSDDDGDGMPTFFEVVINDIDDTVDSDCDGTLTNDSQVRYVYSSASDIGVKYVEPENSEAETELPYHLDSSKDEQIEYDEEAEDIE